MRIERPRGTRDFLPEEMEKRRAVENVMRAIAESFGYREVSTPTFEHLELFTVKSGQDIVEEIYAFRDKSGRNLALRPELTAPVMRLFVNECSVMPRPLRFYYLSNCFRYERPQKGRYREFWQFGVELIGSGKPESDAEIIFLAYRILRSLNVRISLHIGHVGLLREILSDVKDKDRAMRLIDKKEWDELEVMLKKEGVPEIFDAVKEISEAQSLEEARSIYPNFDYSHLESVFGILESLDVSFVPDFGIARGLDYYTGAVFEMYAEGLGAQKQVCGGGSYRLSRLFGGEDVPSTGFAIGFDRVVEVCDVDVERKPTVIVVGFRDSTKAFRVAEMLRSAGVTAIVDVMGRNVKKQLSYADSIKADFAVFAGEELDRGKIRIKNLKTQRQEDIDLEDVGSYFLKYGV